MGGPARHRGKASTTIGQLLMEAGACTQYDLNRALLFQRRHPELRLGECFVRLGRVSATAVDLILAQQTAFRTGRPEDTVKLYDAMGRASRAIQRSVTAMQEMATAPGGSHV
jgi:hypothetical protein